MNEINCHKCNSQLRRFRGCTEDVTPRNIAGLVITRCPLTYLTDMETDRLQAFKAHQNGYLPNGGGWLDQPMKYAQIIGIIDNEVTQAEERKNG